MDEYLIEFCAPTLASIKVGSLFSYAYTSEEDLHRQIRELNQQFGEKGVAVCLLRVRSGRALTYVYRISQLRMTLERPEIQQFLGTYGYDGLDMDAAIQRMKGRICGSTVFPHEIGIFLGYPLEDVAGFIAHGGKECKCAGCWKVYGDEQQAKKKFRQLKKCRDVYRRLWQQGRSVHQLTVAV